MELSSKISVRDVDLSNKRVIMRVDYNVPLDGNRITDNTRIRMSLPSIDYIFGQGAKSITLLSHCGRPDGLRNMKYTLQPVAAELERLSKRKVIFVDECVGKNATQTALNAEANSLILLENLRFHIEEEGKGIDANGDKIKASPDAVDQFRKELSSLGDVFVNDAFGTAHRAHSSMVGINLPIRCAGLLMEKELKYFNQALNNPKKPFLSILGGAKVHDKIQLIENLLDKVDTMIIGGGMAYTFLKVLNGMSIGNSLYDAEGAKIVPRIMEKAKVKNVQILFPVDFVVSSEFGENGTIKSADASTGIPDGFESLDCGPKTVAQAAGVIKSAKTILWNGPQGVSEMKSFAKGSLAFVDAVVEATKNGATSIVGGGDTASLIERAGAADKVSHVSTGGGASLELLEGKTLPGLASLSDAK